jgi:hypothetical protein
MTLRAMIVDGVMIAVALAPALAYGTSILDTGVPTGAGAPLSLSTSQWLAGEFAVTGSETDVPYWLAAYLTQGGGSVGDTFTFDVYSSAGFTNRSSTRPSPVFTSTGTFTGNGWNISSADWTPTVAGDYWLALQVGSTSQTRGLDAPVETSATTGPVPARGFADAPASGQYTTSGAEPIGLEITAATGSGSTDGPLPLWAAVALGTGMVGIASHRFKRAA